MLAWRSKAYIKLITPHLQGFFTGRGSSIKHLPQLIVRMPSSTIRSTLTIAVFTTDYSWYCKQSQAAVICNKYSIKS